MEIVQLKQKPSVNLFHFFLGRQDKFNLLAQAPQKHPDLFQVKIPGRRIIIVQHHEIVQQVLMRNHKNYIKDRGYRVLALLLGNGLITNPDYDDWRKQRVLLQPAFHRESLQAMCNIVVNSTEQLFKNWKAKEGTIINFTHDMAWLTIDVVCKTLFTSDVSEEHIKMVWRNLNFLNNAASKMAGNPYHIPFKFPLPRYNKARKCIAEMNELIYDIIHKRKLQKDPPHDLLQMLIDARYEDGSSMTDEQIRDEVMTVFVAGHETTVNALSWTWYLLKKYPKCEQKLHEESKKFVSVNPSFSDIHVMTYGWKVMNESMRIFPPVPAIGRGVVKDDEAAGYLLDAKSLIVINIAGLHHHPRYWEKPDEFYPEHFDNFELKGDNRFFFMPFGAGPRICIGNNFAMLEMQLINAMLSARVDMELVSEAIEPEPMITLKPGNGVMVRLNKIN